SSRMYPWLTQKAMAKTLTIQRKAVCARNPKKTSMSHRKTAKLAKIALAIAQRAKATPALLATMAPMMKLATAIASAWQGAPKTYPKIAEAALVGMSRCDSIILLV